MLYEALANWEQSLSGILTRLNDTKLQTPGAPLPDSPVFDRLALESLLHRLSEELQNDDAKASRNAAELSRLLADHDCADIARALARHAAQYDYDAAIQDLGTLAKQLNVSL